VAGLASGLLNTSQQTGGALGVAIVGSVAVTHAKSLLRSGHSVGAAYTSGYALGFWIITVFAAAGMILTLATIKPVSESTVESTSTASTMPLLEPDVG
jgi:hypothetical protein